jgi:non-ribosomal peptide synthetase component F
VLDLPVRAPRTSWSAGATDRVRGGMSAEESDALAALATREHTTLFGVLFAAAYTLLGRVTGQSDLVVGTMSAGRDRPELRSLIGLFLNPLALRCWLGDDPTVPELVRRAGETVRSALVHGELPFERVVAAVNPPRRPFRQPLFDVVLNHHPLLPPPRFGDLRVAHVRGIRAPVAPYELMIRTIAQPHGLGVQLDYQRERFDEATVTAWLDGYLALLRGFAQASSATRISRLSTGAATAAE